MCVLFNQNKVPGHSRIQGNEEAPSSQFLGPESTISISPCVSSIKIKEWLQERHTAHFLDALDITKSKIFIGRTSDKLPRDRKQCRLITGLLTAYCTLKLLRKRHDVDRTRNSLTMYFGNVHLWLGIEYRWTSIEMVLALVSRSELSEGP
jgi:hypothetical protein